MSTFTIPLQEVINLTGGTVTLESGVSRLNGGNIGLGHYPIWDEAYRPILNGKIYDHYMLREIGMESIDQFQMFMRVRMNERMPYFNDLYRTTQIEFDPLTTIDIEQLATGKTKDTSTGNTVGTESGESSGTENADSSGTSTNNTTGTNKSVAVTSDTPQTFLSDSEDYATGGSNVKGESASTSNGTQEGTANTTRSGETSGTSEMDMRNESTGEQSSDSKTKGYNGPASMLLMQYRETILNIDLMVISSLSDLFMQVYNNDDSYTRRSYYGI